MAKVIEAINDKWIDGLIQDGYMTAGQATQLLQDALEVQDKTLARKNLENMRPKDFDRLMRTPPGPTRSRRHRKQTKGG